MRTGIPTIAAIALTSAVAISTFAAGQAGVQRKASSPPTVPNISGVWQALTDANWDLEDHSAKPGPPQFGALFATPPGIGVVEGGPIPYRPDALAKRKENFDNRFTTDPEAKCYLPGVPRATYMPYPFQIFQTPKDILIVYEYASAVRLIHMNITKPNPVDVAVDSWMGYSSGRWVGSTLVVEASNFNDGSWFDRAGNYHSEALKVTERYTPTSANAMTYEATIQDSKVFTRPWTIRVPLYRRSERNAQVLEYKCVDFSEELLYGHMRKQTK